MAFMFVYKSWPFCKFCSCRWGSLSLYRLQSVRWSLRGPKQETLSLKYIVFGICVSSDSVRGIKHLLVLTQDKWILVLTHVVHAVFRKSPLRVFCWTWMRGGTLMDWMRTPIWYNLLFLCGVGGVLLVRVLLFCRFLCAMPKARGENKLSQHKYKSRSLHGYTTCPWSMILKI